MHNGIDAPNTIETLMAILAQEQLDVNEVTKEGWARIQPHIPVLFEYINQEFAVEIEIGQLHIEGIANYIIGCCTFNDADIEIFESLYDKPIETSESHFPNIDNAPFYSVLIQNGLVNVIVVRNTDAPEDTNDAFMLVGISGPGQVVLTIFKRLKELW